VAEPAAASSCLTQICCCTGNLPPSRATDSKLKDMADFAAKATYTMRQVNTWLKIKGSEAATACYFVSTAHGMCDCQLQ
jgi:hypothetical protein